jgi:hypothetical protein
MENGSAKGDAKLSYEDSSAAPAAVEWFNGKDYKGKVSVCAVCVCSVHFGEFIFQSLDKRAFSRHRHDALFAALEFFLH